MLHENIKGMVGAISNVLSDEGLNIDNMVNKSKGEWAYTLIDLDTFNGRANEVVEKLNAVEGIRKTRIVKEA